MIDDAAKKALLVARHVAMQGAPQMDFHNASTYTPPSMPPRSAAADYPKGVPLDERGNISRTIEGRPLTAQVVAGRSTLGGSGIHPDRGIDPQTVERLGTEAGGANFLELPPRSLNRDVGKFTGSRDPVTGERKSLIAIRNDLSPEGAENVRAHEVAHLFDWISGKLPVPPKGPVRNEMEQVYHRLSTNKTPEPGWESKYGLKTPEAFGYHGEKANKELAAESIRAYMADPNYIKTVAPRAAALIRKHFNDHPYLSKFIQFNTAALALLGSSGLYSSGGMVGGQDPTHPDITKASGGMIDDPAKAIRRATLIAKGLSRTIGPLPNKDEGERVHPASMVPGVQGYREGGAPSNVANYQDPPSKKMTGFDWRPLSKVHEELGGMSEIPSHVADFGKFMDDTARRAATQGLSPRDLIKAYTITRSSIQREARTADKARAAGLILPSGFTGNVRPEGAFGEWLHSPMGRRYLDAAENGHVDHEAVADASKTMKPFGLTTEAHALPWAAQNLPQHAALVSDMVARAMQNKSTPEEWRGFVGGVHGIGAAKAGFMASLLGRGDQPTLDARQVILHTGRPTSEAKAPLARAGHEAVDRLAARQQAMAFKTPEELAPYYQHLAHHAVWDKVGNQQTTHQDVINAMQHAANGGIITPAHEHPLAHAMHEIGMPGFDTGYNVVDRALRLTRHHTPGRR